MPCAATARSSPLNGSRAASAAARRSAFCKGVDIATVMAGLVPAIHDLLFQTLRTWIPGTSARSKASSPRPGMTMVEKCEQRKKSEKPRWPLAQSNPEVHTKVRGHHMHERTDP